MSLFKNFKSYWSLIIIIILTFIYWCGINSVSPFFSLFSKEINFNVFETSIFLSGMGIARVIFQPFIGIFLTKIDENTAIKITFIIFTISNLGYLLFNNFIILVFCRFADGIAMGFFVIAIRVIINNNFNLGKIKSINVYYSGVKNLGTFIGPSLAGIFFETLGIRSIFMLSFTLFFIGYFISTRLKTNKPTAKKIEAYDNVHFFKKSPFLLFILILHSLEYIGLGLWLSGWPILADQLLNWNGVKIGASFSITAVSSFLIVPFLSQVTRISEIKKIIIGLILLAYQPFYVAFFGGSNELLWISFILGGIGATVYFSSFHSYISSSLKKTEISVFYGFLGIFTFAGQAIGQSLAPILWTKFDYRFPLIIDFILLVLAAILYYFVFKIKFYKQMSTNVEIENET